MDFDDFDAVRAVVRAGTFSAAAIELHVAQPALSRRIARIERELGASLFDRLPRRAAPTALAVALARAAARLESERVLALQEVDAIVRGRAGTVRMSCLAGGIAILARGLARFHHSHPDVWIEIEAHGTEDAVHALREREVDLATLPGASVSADMECRKLARWRAVVVVRPDHPIASRDSVPIAHLAGEPVLLLSPDFMVTQHVVAMAGRAGVQLRPRLRNGTTEAVLSLSRRGLGAGIVPDSVRLPTGVVGVPLAGQGASAEFDYVVAWLRDRTLATAAMELVDTLVRDTAAFR